MFLIPVMENMYFGGDLPLYKKELHNSLTGSGVELVELQSMMHQPSIN